MKKCLSNQIDSLNILSINADDGRPGQGLKIYLLKFVCI